MKITPLFFFFALPTGLIAQTQSGQNPYSIPRNPHDVPPLFTIGDTKRMIPEDLPEKTALYETFTPYIGVAAFPTRADTPWETVNNIAVFNGLPTVPYTVLGDIYIDTEDTEEKALAKATQIAQLAGANGIIRASTAEVYAQEVMGRKEFANNTLRAWAIQTHATPMPKPGQLTTPHLDTQPHDEIILGERAADLPATEKIKATFLTPSPAHPKNKVRIDTLRKELRDNALRQAEAELGVIPNGFNYTSYNALLETIQNQIVQELKTLTN